MSPHPVTLEQIAGLKLRLRTLPDELNVAREAASRLAAEVRDHKGWLADREAEVAVMTRAELLAESAGKKPTEAALSIAVKAAVEHDTTARAHRKGLHDLQLRHDGAELEVRHLEDRFRGLQIYAELTMTEVRLLLGGITT